MSYILICFAWCFLVSKWCFSLFVVVTRGWCVDRRWASSTLVRSLRATSRVTTLPQISMAAFHIAQTLSDATRWFYLIVHADWLHECHFFFSFISLACLPARWEWFEWTVWTASTERTQHNSWWASVPSSISSMPWVWERKKERKKERERETERQRDRETERQREREILWIVFAE